MGSQRRELGQRSGRDGRQPVQERAIRRQALDSRAGRAARALADLGNRDRQHGACGDVPPAEFEAANWKRQGAPVALAQPKPRVPAKIRALRSVPHALTGSSSGWDASRCSSMTSATFPFDARSGWAVLCVDRRAMSSAAWPCRATRRSALGGILRRPSGDGGHGRPTGALRRRPSSSWASPIGAERGE